MKKLSFVLLASIILTAPAVADVIEVPLDVNDQPLAMTVGPDGNLWVTTAHFGKIHRVTPAGTKTTFVSGSTLLWDITTGPDGALWYNSGDSLGRMTTSGAETLFPVVETPGGTTGITTGADGTLWFGGFGNSTIKIGHMTTGGSVSMIADHLPGLFHLARAGDGNVWFPAFGSIMKITPGGTVSTAVSPASVSINSGGFVAAPDGSIWFCDFNARKVVQAMMNGTRTDYAVPDNSEPESIAFASDGSTWFATTTGAGHIVASAVTFYPIASPRQWHRPAMAITSNGRLWMAQHPVTQPPPPPSASATAVIGARPELLGIDPQSLPDVAQAPVPATGPVALVLLAAALTTVALLRMR